MDNLLRVNSIHLELLEPLLKWRILDLKSIREKISYPLGKRNFEKIVSRLEKESVLESVTDPWSRKKFIYLTKFGAGLVDGSFYYPVMNKETIFHDAKVAEVVQKLMRNKCFSKFLLEHEINESREIGRSVGEIPDALIQGRRRDVNFRLAFELELSRKSKSRIIAKVKRYLSTGYYDYILYLFCSDAIYRGYRKVLEEEFGADVFKRVMLLNNSTLLSTKFNIENSKGWFNGQEIFFNDLFK